MFMKHNSSHEALKKQTAKPEMLYEVTISAGRSPNMRVDGASGLTEEQVRNYMQQVFPNFMDAADGLQIDIVPDYLSMQDGDQYTV